MRISNFITALTFSTISTLTAVTFLGSFEMVELNVANSETQGLISSATKSSESFSIFGSKAVDLWIVLSLFFIIALELITAVLSIAMRAAINAASMVENKQVLPRIAIAVIPDNTIKLLNLKFKVFKLAVSNLNDTVAALSSEVDKLHERVEKNAKKKRDDKFSMQKLAHEVITPLNSLQKQISQLRKQVGHKNLIAVQEMHVTTEFASTVLQMATKTHLSTENTITYNCVDVRDLIEHSFKMATYGRPGRMDGIDLDIIMHSNIGNNFPFLMTDKVLIQAILVNIFNNSLKYSDRSKIKVSVSNSSKNPLDINSKTTFIIEDRGQGFSKETLKSDFCCLRKKSEGTSFGMGLCLINQYLRRLGSKLVIRNILNKHDEVVGARCEFSIQTQHAHTSTIINQTSCRAALYTSDESTKERISRIFKEKDLILNFISNDDLEVTSENNILLVDYEADVFSVDDIRAAASQHDDITLILLCSKSELKAFENDDMLQPYHDPEQPDLVLNNIYALSKPVITENLLDIILENSGYEAGSLNPIRKDALIIEDNQREREELIAFLGRSFNIKVAETIDSAKEYLSSCDFDLIVSDVHLDNHQHINELAESFANSKAVKIGHCGLSVVTEDCKQLFNYIVTKSSNFSGLKDTINIALRVLIPMNIDYDNYTISEERYEEFRNGIKKVVLAYKFNDLAKYVSSIHSLINTINKLRLDTDSIDELIEHEQRLGVSESILEIHHLRTLNLIEEIKAEVKSKL